MRADWKCPLPQTPPPLPMLITGVAGVAGYNAFRYFHAAYPGQVIGTRRADNWRLSGAGIEVRDADNRDHLARLFDRHQFRSVLNCEGLCKLKSCELDSQLARRVNVVSTRCLVDELRTTETRLLHLSVDLVFSGNGPDAGGYVEDDQRDPVTIYGRTMAEAEDLLLADASSACILRISLPMGVSFNGHAGAIDWIQSRFRQGKPATLYHDEVRSPAYTDCLNRVFARLLGTAHRGIFHAGGPRRLTLFQIAQIVNRTGGYDPLLLQTCSRFEAGPVPPRAGNVTMNSEKLATALGQPPFTPWPWFDDQVPTDARWHFEPSRAIQPGPQAVEQTLYRNPAYAV